MEQAPFDKLSPIPPQRSPLVVLVRPQLGENIGAVARAMLNFSLVGLRIVDPRDGWPNPAAGPTAAGAHEVLDGARVFDTVADAIADCSYVVATTARQRGLFVPVFTPEEACGHLAAQAQSDRRTAILFGAEKSGLSSDEVAFADAIVTIPTNPEFSSLNIAQSVVVIAYAWAKTVATPKLFDSPYDETRAERAAVEGMVGHMIEALDGVGYFYPPDKRAVLERNVRTLLTNAAMTEAEVRLFRGMIRQLMRPQETPNP